MIREFNIRWILIKHNDVAYAWQHYYVLFMLLESNKQIVLALILGPMAEGNFRRSLVMSQGSYAIFIQRPIAAAFIVVAVIALLYPIIKTIIVKSRRKEAS